MPIRRSGIWQYRPDIDPIAHFAGDHGGEPLCVRAITARDPLLLMDFRDVDSHPAIPLDPGAYPKPLLHFETGTTHVNDSTPRHQDDSGQGPFGRRSRPDQCRLPLQYAHLERFGIAVTGAVNSR